MSSVKYNFCFRNFKISKMFSRLSSDENRRREPKLFNAVLKGLGTIYKNKLFPLEEHYLFHEFHSPPLDDPDFDAKPMILLVGQHPTGKSTFMRYLLDKDFPGIRIGPEPAADRFTIVMHDSEETVIPGNALVVDPKKQFRPLSKFGDAFLNRLQCSMVNCEVLQSITIVDTPGILSGEKQRVDRGYDFAGVLEWFAERVDRIILLFDAHKLDISDEFRRSIEALRGHDDKIRIVLNKADMINLQQLTRAYGALMWSLGKMLNTPEVLRVYLESDWDQPLRFDYNSKLFQTNNFDQDLIEDLLVLQRKAAVKKFNDFIRRARLAQAHAYIISSLHNSMPYMFNKERRKKELIQNLQSVYDEIVREHHLPPGAFPDIREMQEKLVGMDFSKFHPLMPRLLKIVGTMLSADIVRLMAQIPHEGLESEAIEGGAFDGVQQSPFTYGRRGVDAGSMDSEWIVSRERYKYDGIFQTLNPVAGKITKDSAIAEMRKSKLPNSILRSVWRQSDLDKDGMFDSDEFALAMYIIDLKLQGYSVSFNLPAELIPPSKKSFIR